jgi:hypothetical protein
LRAITANGTASSGSSGPTASVQPSPPLVVHFATVLPLLRTRLTSTPDRGLAESMSSAQTATVCSAGLPGALHFLATSDMLVSKSRDVAWVPTPTSLSSSTPLVVAGNRSATSSQLVAAASGSPRSGTVFLRITSLVRSVAASLASPSQNTRFSAGTWRITRFALSTLVCLIPRLVHALRGR